MSLDSTDCSVYIHPHEKHFLTGAYYVDPSCSRNRSCLPSKELEKLDSTLQHKLLLDILTVKLSSG